MNDSKKLKAQVLQDVESRRPELIDLSLRIHSEPELGLQEFKASELLTQHLASCGFKVEKGIAGLDTAFRARYGSGNPVIAFIAEYDALPELGHACGHNIIASAAVGAAIASKKVMDRLGGEVQVIGTPAEELYGGKAIMVERAAFSGLDVAMMVHPGARDTAISWALACASLDVEFTGKAAHAAAHPDEGINALDALIIAFNNINSLRQHLKADSRVHGIITEGGEAANIVPAHTQGQFLIRAEDMDYLGELKERILDCFVAASVATGARLEYRWGYVTYAPLRTNLTLAELFSQNMQSLGRTMDNSKSHSMGSTDMGNVSQVIPSIHPNVSIVPVGVSEHSPEFAEAAASEAGHRGLTDGAKALALTLVDILIEPQHLKDIKNEFLQ